MGFSNGSLPAGMRQPSSHAPSSRDSLGSGYSRQRSRPENGAPEGYGGRGNGRASDARLLHESASSGSEKQASRSKQQVLDKWRLDQHNPDYDQVSLLPQCPSEWKSPNGHAEVYWPCRTAPPPSSRIAPASAPSAPRAPGRQQPTR